MAGLPAVRLSMTRDELNRKQAMALYLLNKRTREDWVEWFLAVMRSTK